MKKIDLACIVDDDPMHVFITKRHLKHSGQVHKIIICRNGKDAYHTLHALVVNEQTLPNVIFLDLNMPIWDGWQFLDEFTKIEVKNPIMIYILTSSNNEEDFKKAAQYSLVNNYFVKPISQHEIGQILKDLNKGCD